MTRQMRRRGWVLAAFTAALLAATHWPGAPPLADGAPTGLDKWAHGAMYATWMAMALWARLAPGRSVWSGILLTLLIGTALAGVDEVTQGMRLFGRQPSVADFFADLGGLAATSAAAGLRASTQSAHSLPAGSRQES